MKILNGKENVSDNTEKEFRISDVISSLTLEDITKIVNAFTDIKIPIEAVKEEIELNYSQKQTGMIQIEFYPDGSIKSVSKDCIPVFVQDRDGNVGIESGGHNVSLHIYAGSGSVGLTPLGFSPSEKLIVNPNSGPIVVEPIPVGNSKPMKRLNVSTNGYLENR